MTTELEAATERLTNATREAFPPQRRGSGKRKAVINYEQVKELTQQGRTAAQIAVQLGCSASAINQIRRRLGITNPNKWLTHERRQRIEALIEDGCSQAEICRTEGVDPETMRRHYPAAIWTQEQQTEYLRTLRIGRTWNWNAA